MIHPLKRMDPKSGQDGRVGLALAIGRVLHTGGPAPSSVFRLPPSARTVRLAGAEPQPTAPPSARTVPALLPASGRAHPFRAAPGVAWLEPLGGADVRPVCGSALFPALPPA